MNQESQTTNKSRGLRLLILLALAAGFAAFFALGGGEQLNLATLKSHREELQNLVAQNYLTVLAGAILLYAALVAFSIPGGTVMSLTMGFLFGRWAGTAAIVCAATVGATLVFLAARYLFADSISRLVGERGKKISEGFSQDAFNYMLFLRLVPLFPFWLVNIVPAFTSIKLRTFTLATAIGIIPGSFVFANLGVSLAHIESARQLVSAEVLVALGLLGVFSLLPIFIKKRRAAKG
ncbi:MAG: TVP38/TMEM64 family protein [Burkholderiales bacterium]